MHPVEGLENERHRRGTSSTKEDRTHRNARRVFPIGINDRAVSRRSREAAVRVAAEDRGQVVELTNIFEGKILAVGVEAITVSLEGSPDKLDDFEELLRGYGIVELQRTGRVALPKLDKEARARTHKNGKAS